MSYVRMESVLMTNRGRWFRTRRLRLGSLSRDCESLGVPAFRGGSLNLADMLRAATMSPTPRRTT
jgi:hypothetical protein